MTDNTIPIFGGSELPQFMLRLAQAVAKGEIDRVGIIYRHKGEATYQKVLSSDGRMISRMLQIAADELDA